MDFSSILNKNEPHQRIILHLDMDYFYAQVEEIRDPKLRTLPLGVQQKNCVVTCNYIAREMGVKKLMSVSEAKRLCPSLNLVNGEDLAPYRQMSQQIFDLLHNFTPAVEKLGFDENFLDITSLVNRRCQSDLVINESNLQIVGHIYPSDGAALQDCSCGCAVRLAIATQIAQEIRDEIHKKLGMTCCAGVSYNKLLAKLVGSQNKPNQQTVLVSSYAEQFMRELKDLNRITGIGQKTQSLLLESGIGSVEELQTCSMDFLKKKFGFETATKLKDLSFGRDNGAVRPSGKPKTIGLEDSCRPISLRAEVEERFRMLLMRLMEQVAEDGRIPIAIKVVLRKFDAQKKTSHRETKQTNLQPSLFKVSNSASTGAMKMKVVLADDAQDKLLKIIMRLFERVIDLGKPFNITLLGLAFSKFQQRKVGSSSIANFLIKKDDLEVQSITSLTNAPDCSSPATTPTPGTPLTEEEFRSSPTTFQPSDQFYRRRTAAASPIPMLVGDNGSESGATNSDFSDFSETEVEPSPKKSRISRLIASKRRCLGSAAIFNSENAEMASPSKLRVCDLRLNSRDSEKDLQISPCATTPTTPTPTITTTTTTQNPAVLSELNIRPTLIATRQLSIASTSPMDEGSPTPSSPPNSINITSNVAATITGNLANIPCPTGVDPQVFNELPISVQNELISSWRSSLAAAAAAVVNDVANSSSVTSATQTSNNHATTKAGGASANSSQKNTLYRYFLRNK